MAIRWSAHGCLLSASGNSSLPEVHFLPHLIGFAASNIEARSLVSLISLSTVVFKIPACTYFHVT